MLAVAGILASASGIAAAEGNSPDSVAKKVEQGVGRLLQDIGEAAKKAGESFSASTKKDDKKAKPKPAERDDTK